MSIKLALAAGVVLTDTVKLTITSVTFSDEKKEVAGIINGCLTTTLVVEEGTQEELEALVKKDDVLMSPLGIVVQKTGQTQPAKPEASRTGCSTWQKFK